MTAGAEKRLYTRAEAAEYLGKSLRDLDRCIADSVIIAKKDGRRTRIDRRELDRYADRLPSLEPGRAAS